MSTFALTNPDMPNPDLPGPHAEGADASTSPDEFSILEQRVLRTVELLKTEREARATAEGNATTLQQLLDEQSVQLAETESRLQALEQERTSIRGRVERMMKQLDDVAG